MTQMWNSLTQAWHRNSSRNIPPAVRRRTRRKLGRFEFLEQRLALSITLLPVVEASIHDEPRDGVGDLFNESLTGLLREQSTREDRAVVEFDLATVGEPIDLAVLDFTLSSANAAGSQRRSFDVSVYAGNGLADLSDFAVAGTSVATVSFSVPQGSDTYRLDVTAEVQALAGSGTTFIGIKWDPLGDVFPVIAHEATLTINGVAANRSKRGWEATPNAIRADGSDTFRLEVDAGGAVKSVTLDTLFTSSLLIAPGSGVISLRDDGLNGDRVAGDFIYTSGEFRYNTSQTFPDFFEHDPDSPPGVAIVGIGTVQIEELDGSLAEQFLIQPDIGLVRSDLPAAPTQILSGQVQVSAHLINVQTDALAVQYSMRGGAFRVNQVTQPIYQVLPDSFDFLNFFSTNHAELSPRLSPQNFRAGVQHKVKVDHTGSALTPFDGTSNYGSAGRLLGLNLLDTMDRGMHANNMTHELVHQWSAYFDKSLNLTSTFGHFAHNTSAGSLVGGQAWTPNGDGSYTINFDEGRNGATHASAIDLYMMGLVEASEVPEILSYDPALSKSPSNPVVQPHEIVGNVSIDDIIALHGPRTPGVATSQKNFRLGFVAESHNRFLTPTEMTFYEIFAAHYTRSTPAGEADPYVGFGWSSIDRFFGHGTTWSTLVPGQSETANQPPTAETATFSVSDQASNGTLVGTVAAEDPDSGQLLQYSIIAGNPGRTFEIDRATGAIRVAKSTQLTQQTQYVLAVRVADNGLPSQYDTVEITINVQESNVAPVIEDQEFSIAENSASGTVVGQVTASDDNAGQTLSFAITAGNTSNAFALDPATGQLTVDNAAMLDFELYPAFVLTVAVTDNGTPPLTSSAQVTVNLIDRLEIVGDLKPGDDSNTLDSKADAKFEIAILSLSTFDATTRIDIDSLRFGRTGNEDSLARHRKTRRPTYELRDVNGDGLLDLVATFEFNNTGLTTDDTLSILTGVLDDGTRFEVQFDVTVTSGGGKGGGGKGNGGGNGKGKK